ncbi:CAP domain-containing protein [Streptomyces huiliensis]|uniref:CAP domain-containing protein n=1 Tax=Streptomyces huiliensis TaxID=2876027 RepID=UPI001CBDC80A|nr:CAP domain-containing protein [Streptomyces huiliensis]MBZ4322535.1 TerD family protein [Streptomyces huiliensis]
MSTLVPGAILELPDGALSLEVTGPYDVSVLITGADGKVAGDADFVFYNQPSAPGVRLGSGRVAVDRTALRPGASRLTVVVSPADPGARPAALPVPDLRVGGPGGRALARFAPPRPTDETVLLLAEVYRRGPGWRLRALGQGYADGLAGVARDFGVEVADETGPAAHAPETEPVPDDARVFAALVNAERARAGVPPVSADARLAEAARRHADGMARQGRLGTEGPSGISVFQQVTACGYAYLGLAEQLVSGPRSPAELLEFCLGDARSSDPVRDPALTAAGVAHAVDARSGDTFWTALWARPFSPDGLARTAADVLALTNARRTAAGLRPLSGDPRLTAAAQAHSADMAARGYHAHVSPDGGRPWDRAVAAGSVHRSIGENVACGQRSPAEVVEGWMNSPGHRANILAPGFTHLGVGFAGGGPAGTYWTQLFGGSA